MDQETAKELTQLCLAYAKDMDGYVTAYDETVDQLEHQAAELVQQKADAGEQLKNDVAARTKQFLMDIKAVIEPAPEQGKKK